jgi:hypothetical protein
MKLGYVPIYPGAAQQALIEDAEQDIQMQGHASHFMNGVAGLTWACAMSNMAKDPENRKKFPHPVREVFVTAKTTLYIMTGEKYNNIFKYIKYAHNFGLQLDLNDAHLSQNIAKTNPAIFEGIFTLRAPSTKKRVIQSQSSKRASSKRGKPFIPRGATTRAVNAGIMTLAEAEQRVKTMDDYERERLHSRK